MENDDQRSSSLLLQWKTDKKELEASETHLPMLDNNRQLEVFSLSLDSFFY